MMKHAAGFCVWVCTYPSTASVNVDGKLATEEIDTKPPLKFFSFHQLEHSSEIIMEQAVLKKPFSAVKHTLLASLLSLFCSFDWCHGHSARIGLCLGHHPRTCQVGRGSFHLGMRRGWMCKAHSGWIWGCGAEPCVLRDR